MLADPREFHEQSGRWLDSCRPIVHTQFIALFGSRADPFRIRLKTKNFGADPIEFAKKMPKAEKQRPKHSVSLATQLQNDRNPRASESNRKSRRRKAEDEEKYEKKEQIVSGKLGQRILAMAREQLDEDEDAEESDEKEDMMWRERNTLDSADINF